LWGHETLSIHFLSPYSRCNGAGQGLFTLLHANFQSSLLCRNLLPQSLKNKNRQSFDFGLFLVF